MLSISEIEKQYPDNLRPYKRNILREYLQYKILEIVFNSKYAKKLSFMGGTALRIAHGNTRFSEDLDFDNFGLSEEEFSDLSEEVLRGMSKLGFEAEIKKVFKGAFHCHVKIPKLLRENDLSDMETEKINIQIDTVPQRFPYQPDEKIINKFDVFTQIFVTPLDILLSQKIYAICNRKRAKGRDFFDFIFLANLAKPNYQYLKEKMGVDNWKDLKTRLELEVLRLDMDVLSSDVEPFLFNPSDSKRIRLFAQYIKQLEF